MWRAVELRELRVFLVLAEELHFGRTADRLGLTQSRVSQSIRDLERKLGLHLAARTSRRVVLTADGERFRRDAGRALDALEDVLRAAQDSGEQLSEPVRLGIMSPAQITPVLRELVDAFMAAHPGNGVEFVGLPFADRFAPLRGGDVQLVVTSLPIDQPDLATGPVLSRHPRLLAAARTHPLARGTDVSIEDLADHPIGDLAIAAPPELADEMTPRHTPSGRPIPRAGPTIRHPTELLLAVASGAVVQPVLAPFAATFQHPDVVYLPIRDLPPSRSVLVWRRHDRHPGLREFLQIARTALRGRPAG
ncbi:DNA-binding transcriptional regulator, LysR family [Geodermatophilus africanus]|uniref:DNA-binding transcriptional regulator, LysR family n=1 Tax=Geodermatophilus africanus TaxID=1137993 RepID=A0A1H3DPM8_9ACTN|nr:LysR family transcriptional regulator [Geodermatophilus africanus]SDX68341.1 DNA-binding transcriptional regulator, LysR family [Geodermatophilus africanus]